MKTNVNGLKLILVIFFIIGCQSSGPKTKLALESNPSKSMGELSSPTVGQCNVIFKKIDCWFDDMPPVPAGGRPLIVLVQFDLDNSNGDKKKLLFQTSIIDESGNSYSSEFVGRFTKGRFPWDGWVEAGAKEQVEIITWNGPKLSVGSKVRAEIIWTDQIGNKAAIKTSDAIIGVAH